ncbi:MAG: MoxR family ATPase [Dehalococcoidia bacterium]|nr:MoxR family ATPase [Dehalococcoidia bacterium]
MDQSHAQDIAGRIIDNIQKVIIGKAQAVELAVIALLSQGHILIEDVPGVGKTMLAKSLARSTDCVFRRIQLTPDMLPSDITGVSIFNQQSREFEFRPGPILGQIVLADEINRATPKTQSALLEAMEERQVTVDGTTHKIAAPFMLMATENPIEHEGIFPLPEAQLDRFMIRIQLGYPSFADEMSIIDSQRLQHPIDGLGAVASADEVSEAQSAIREVFVHDQVKRYIVSLVHATRAHDDAALGASPRAGLALFRSCQALALLRGRDYVLPDDVKELAVPVMGHRVIVTPSARMKRVETHRIIEDVIEQVAVPGGRATGWVDTTRD